MTTLYCAFCEDPVGDDHVKIDDDPVLNDRSNDEEEYVVHPECWRRHQASLEQTRRMFETNPQGPWHSEPIYQDIDEDELDAELNKLGAELEDELGGDDE